jgi:hypothetical protein
MIIEGYPLIIPAELIRQGCTEPAWSNNAYPAGI